VNQRRTQADRGLNASAPANWGRRQKLAPGPRNRESNRQVRRTSSPAVAGGGLDVFMMTSRGRSCRESRRAVAGHDRGVAAGARNECVVGPGLVTSAEKYGEASRHAPGARGRLGADLSAGRERFRGHEPR